MRTINSVDIFDCADLMYSHSGFLVLDNTLKPVGIFLPAVAGFDETSKVADLKVADLKVKKLTDSYKVMMGL